MAQRCLWEFDASVVFHGPEVDQERNPHNLMRDFADEIPGYLRNAEIVELLGKLSLEPGLAALRRNLLACYGVLVKAGVLPAAELPLVKAWLEDLPRTSA